MQKKTRSRLSEAFFIFICVCCSLFSIYQFYQSLNKTLVKDEEPVATISFKYKTAQRKFLNENLWDRLQQDSPVYEGDTIRTAEQSEATLSFTDGAIMELQSNTMIRVNMSEDGSADIDFTSGAISVRTTENTSMKIRSGTSVVDVAAGASVAAAGSSDDTGALKVAVKEGTASFTGEGGTIDLEAGKVTEINAAGTVEEHFLSVNYPEDNYRVMTFNSASAKIPFSWESSGRQINLEISDSKNFDKITESRSFFRNISSAELTMAEGSHWWRITTMPASDDEEPETVSGKITVLYSPAPTLISPRMGTNTTYRTKLPQVRLSWSESERATAYRLDIADNASMTNPVISQRCTTTSAIITSLGEGTWYWCVTPYYTFNDIGYAEPSDKSYFRITRNAELNAPQLQSPEQDGLVCTQTQDANGKPAYRTVLFSWKNDPEAVSYDITMWSGSSKTPFLTKTVTGSYCSIDTSKDRIPKGDVSWQVTIHDEEGNTKSSEIRSFVSLDADIEQKTLNPPDRYRVIESLSSLDFTWKTNVPYATTVQIARDANFNNIVWSQETKETKVTGRQLPAGTYYWRVTSKAGSLEIATPAKTFTVEPLLKQATLTEPENGSQIVILRPEGEESILVSGNQAISWQPVQDADYYHFTLFNTAKPQSPVIEQDIKTTSVPIDIETIAAGNYRWSVSAYRNESTSASRSYNTEAARTFSIKELKKVSVPTIMNTTELDGVTAWTEPARFTWKTADTPLTWTLRLYNGERFVGSFKSSPLQVPQLEAGTYKWTATATDADGNTVYETDLKTFTVTPIPLLGAPELIEPETGTVFDVDYLAHNQTISFAWTPVENATEYRFTLTDSAGRKLASETLPAGTTEYVLKDLSSLENGTITWTVQAVRRLKGSLSTNREKVLTSDISTSEFTIDLPVLQIPQIKDFGKRYGM